MVTRIAVRRDTAANWASANPVPAAGEPTLETDTGITKYGDGVTRYSGLPASKADLSYSAKGYVDNAVLNAQGQVIVPPTVASAIDPLKMYAEPGTKLTIPTYVVPDTGQATHPSVLAFPQKFAGYEYWMGFTPYPGSVDSAENPSILASHDGITWVVPAGLTNPIDQQTGGTIYNSDTDLVQGPDGKLWLFWRTVDVPNSQEIIYLSKSVDGVVWSSKVAIYTQPFAVRRLLSPTFIYEDGAWTMWAVDLLPVPNTIIRMRSTGSDLAGNSSWNTPVVCTYSALAAGKEPWHIFIRRVGGQYVALLTDTTLGTSGTSGTQVILMTSSDGLAWTNGSTSTIPLRQPNLHNRLYRSSFVPIYVNGSLVLRTWYAGVLDTSSPPTWNLFLTDIKSITVGTDPYMLAPGEPVPAWLPPNRNIVRLAASPGEVRRNKMVNPGPGGGVTAGWSGAFLGTGGAGSPSISSTGGPAKASPNFYRWTFTTAPSSTTIYASVARATNDDILVTPGDVVTISAWIRPSWTGASTGVRALFYTSAGALIGGEVLGEIFPHAQNTWESRDLVGIVVPATASRIALRLYSQNSTPVVGSTYDVSSVLVEKTDHVRDYFDGAQKPYQDGAVTPGWVGTANASESTLSVASSYRQFWDGSAIWAV